MWFARKRLRPNQVSAISAHERTPPRGHSGGVRHPVAEGPPPPVSRLHFGTQTTGRLPALGLRARENLVKAPLAPGTSGGLPRCARSALGAQWGDPTSVDATPPSAWRWRARSMTRKPAPPCCTWRRFGFVWQAKGTCQTRKKNAVRARRERLPRRSPWRASPRPAPFPA